MGVRAILEEERYKNGPISASWYYPPEEWKPLARWFGETCRILDKAFERTWS